MNLFTLLELAAAGDPDRALLGPSIGGRTAENIRISAVTGARYLADARFESLIFVGQNGPSFPLAMFAAAGAAVPFLPLNYRWTIEQLAEAIASAPNPLVISDVAEFDETTAARRLSTGEWMTLCSSGDPGQIPPRSAAPDDIALLLMTSGTTSKPKRAVLRHRHLASYVIESVEFAASGVDESILVSVPPYHIAAVANLLSNLYSGRRIVYLESFGAREWLDLAARERITHAMLVPTMLSRIVEELEAHPALVPPALRFLSYGGARVAQPLLERALAALPEVAFVNAYGLTETSSTIAVLTAADHRAALSSDDPAVRARLGSVGRPLPAIQIEIRSPNGQACPPGTIGAIFVRGPQVAGEYLETGDVTGEDGWFATRDEGLLDAEGYLFVRGRADDTIIRGGENIAPAEIEAVLLQNPAIADAAVVGIADEEWGHRIAAYVVPQDGTRLDEKAVQAAARCCALPEPRMSSTSSTPCPTARPASLPGETFSGSPR
jgi:acyl-CoA synthetase (AMP-forming)/AMP-acid ligase II